MKKLFYFGAALLFSLTACEKNFTEFDNNANAPVGEGILKVSLAYETFPQAKAVTDYTEVLDAEKAEKSVSVLVFDKASGQLNVLKSLSKTSDAFSATVPAGEKTVYAVVNGPDLSQITTISQLTAMTDDLANTTLAANGLTMIGSADCTVQTGVPATAAITVRRLVARIVIEKITNNLPAAYGKMTVDAVYLGNANSVQTFAGSSSNIVNPYGYADVNKTQEIGKNNILGSCSDYMYRQVSTDVTVGSSYSTPLHMYSQPNSTSNPTLVCMLLTIGGMQYYYTLPLIDGILANHTYSISFNVVNLGTDPGKPLEKEQLSAFITVAGWSAGYDYSAEF